MAAGERAAEPLAELSHYVVARPIYSEAGFQDENERRPPLPPTLRERAQAACRWVPGGPGTELGAAPHPRGPPRAPRTARWRRVARGEAAPEESGSASGLLLPAKGSDAGTRGGIPAGGGVWGIGGAQGSISAS